MTHDIKKGDVLYRVFRDHRVGSDQEVVVTSVGTKWITIDKPRQTKFERDTLREHYSQLWLSKAEYELHQERMAAWKMLRDFVTDNRIPPDGLPTQTIRMARELLNFKEIVEPASA